MSSKPTPQGVAKTIELVKSISELNAECERLAPIALRLRKAREELDRSKMLLEDQLRSMDVEQTGNAGWASRFGWFLGEFLRQALDDMAQADRAAPILRGQIVDTQALDARRYRRLRARGVVADYGSGMSIGAEKLDSFVDDSLMAYPD